MPRTFTKNASNYLMLGLNTMTAVITQAAVLSFAAKVRYRSLGAINGDRVFYSPLATNLTGLSFATDGAGHFRVGGRSTSGDGFQTADSLSLIPVDGVSVVEVGGVYDFAAGQIRLYFNGRLEVAKAVTWGATRYNPVAGTDSDTIGCNTQNTGSVPTNTAGQVDGDIGDFVVWKTDIKNIGFANYSAGVSPWRIAKPAFYMPLTGLVAPERDRAGTGIVGTMTGAVPPAPPYAYRPPFMQMSDLQQHTPQAWPFFGRTGPIGL